MKAGQNWTRDVAPVAWHHHTLLGSTMLVKHDQISVAEVRCSLFLDSLWLHPPDFLYSFVA